MAVKKDLPTMVEGVTGSASAGKTNTNTSGNKTTTTTTSNSTPSATPDKMPSVPNTTGTSTTTKASVNTTPVTSLNSKDEDYYDNLYVKGGWTQNQQEAISHGSTGEVGKTNSKGDWYSYETAERPYYTDDADATFMSGSDYYLTTQNKNAWNALNEQKKAAQQAGNTALVAQLQAQMDTLHAANEAIRAGYGYSGGEDGSMYYIFSSDDSNTQPDMEGYTTGQTSGTGSSSGSVTMQPSIEQIQRQNELREMLDAWQKAALEQSNGQIDYAVQKAVTDLERALADVQPQFKEQAESVDRDARQAMDNSALYAELRGDKGGIGHEQYNSIQNTQAQNHLTVQQAQTKLATDTQRQIADLRAQGEFEKADAALQITQQYLQQLVSLEKWAAEYNLSVEQFNEQIRQWEMEYQFAMQQFETSKQQWAAEFGFQQQQYQNSLNQWQAEFDAAQNRWQAEFDYGKQSDMANIGWALLESGVSLSKEQLAAMGIDEAQASQILMQQQLKAAGIGNDDVKMTLTTAKELAKNGIFNEQVLSVLHQNGYSDEAISTIYGYAPEQPTYVEPTVAQAASYETLKGHVNAYPSRGITISDIAYMIESALKRGNITDAQAEELLNLIDQKVG